MPMTNTAFPRPCCSAAQYGACSHTEDAAYEANVADEPIAFRLPVVEVEVEDTCPF